MHKNSGLIFYAASPFNEKKMPLFYVRILCKKGIPKYIASFCRQGEALTSQRINLPVAGIATITA